MKKENKIKKDNKKEDIIETINKSKTTEEKEKKITKTKIIKCANRFFNSIGFPILIDILLFLKTMFFYINTVNVSESIEKETVLGTIAILTTIIWVIAFLPNKIRTITTIVIDLLFSIILWADNIYYTYSSSVLSVAQIMNLQYGEEIISTLPMLIKLKQILYFIDIIIILILLGLKTLRLTEKKKLKLKINILKIVIVIISLIIFFRIDNRYISRANDHPYNKDVQIKLSTIYGYHISDIKNTINIKKQAIYSNKKELMTEYEQLKEAYEEKYGNIIYDLEGIAEGKNVIILQLESIQEFVINKKINGQEITPNLNKFINENIEISNMYMQSYSTTADSEFSTITSLYPMENGMSYSRYYTNHYDNLFTMFKNENYTTSYMHGNYGYFWNRANVYKEFEVENVELKDKFEDISENISGYLSDELLYKQAVQKLKNYDMPFVSYIVSASSHTPFSLDGLEDKSKMTLEVGKYENTFFGNYLKSVNYADYAFGVFIEELKRANLYDDTIIFVFGDHNGLDMYNEEMIEFLQQINPNLTDTDIKLNYIKVACAMRIPGIKHITIEKPVSKLDIKPTFAYLINGDAGFSLGTNIFARKDFICLNNERMVTSRYYFDEKWYRIKDGTEVNLEEIPQDEKELLEEYYKNMKKELDMSISISINNLLK